MASADGFMSGQFTNIDVCIWRKTWFENSYESDQERLVSN